MTARALPFANQTALGLIVLAGLSALCVFASHEFTREAGRIASIWPLNAVLVATAIRWRTLDWRAVVATGALSNFAVDLAMGDTPMRAVLLTSANALEVIVCLGLLRRACADDDDVEIHGPNPQVSGGS